MLERAAGARSLSFDSRHLVKVYVINLRRRRDRWSGFQERARAQGLEGHHRFDAVDGRLLDPGKLGGVFDLASRLLRHPLRPDRYRTGVLGCALSHYGIWRELASRQDLEPDQHYLVLEDDVTFRPNARVEAGRVHRRLVGDPRWEILYLGYTDDRDLYGDFQVHQGVERLTGVRREYGGGTFAYCLRKKAARRLVEIVREERIRRPVDDFLMENFRRIVCYKCRPHLAFSEAAILPHHDTDVQYPVA